MPTSGPPYFGNLGPLVKGKTGRLITVVLPLCNVPACPCIRGRIAPGPRGGPRGATASVRGLFRAELERCAPPLPPWKTSYGAGPFHFPFPPPFLPSLSESHDTPPFTGSPALTGPFTSDAFPATFPSRPMVKARAASDAIS